jgi:hypothetical protein
MTNYLILTALGLMLFFGAFYADRTVTRSEPELAVIEPTIPRICFVAKSLGVMIFVAALGATICAALS